MSETMDCKGRYLVSIPEIGRKFLAVYQTIFYMSCSPKDTIRYEDGIYYGILLYSDYITCNYITCNICLNFDRLETVIVYV